MFTGPRITPLLLSLVPACTEPVAPGPPPAAEPETHSIVICGHLYSTYVESKIEKKPAVHSDRVLRAFADELERISPEAVFFLGDNTRYSLKEEWDVLGEVFEGVDTLKVFLPGNHELRGREAFFEAGGVTNASFVIHGDKYVTLDAKDVYQPEDLAFLERELADHEAYDHVFLLTHHFFVNYADPVEGQPEFRDPFGGDSFLRNSNWNRDIVPRIAGKVDFVFCGDYYPHNVRTVQHYEEHAIQYVMTSFLFGRGLGTQVTGDGPLLFVELSFRDGELSIVPRTVPLDMRDPWYRDYKTRALPGGRRVEVGELSFLVPHGWHVEQVGAGEVLRVVDRREPVETAAELRVQAWPLGPEGTLEEFAAERLDEFRTRLPSFRPGARELEELGGVKVIWTRGQDPLGEVESYALSLYFVHGSTGYLARGTGSSERTQDSFSTLEEMMRSVRFEGVETVDDGHQE